MDTYTAPGEDALGGAICVTNTDSRLLNVTFTSNFCRRQAIGSEEELPLEVDAREAEPFQESAERPL